MKFNQRMESTFKVWKRNRKLYLDFFETYNLEQLNKIPDGFNNNLVWNIGHIIVAQQVLIYKSSDLEGYISDELINQYKPGTKPTRQILDNEVNKLKELLISLIDRTESDFFEGKFLIYHERTTSMGFHIASLKDALEYNNYHEGLHLGYMMNIRKLF